MATTYNTPTTDSAIKFKAGTYANLPAERDSNTLYFCTDTQQLFVGTDEYTRRLKTGAGAPSADATGTPTNGFYWDSTNNELYSNIGGTWTKIGTVKIMGAATSSTAGTAGLVPAPAAGKQTSFLRGDGTWVVPTDTTYTAATDVAAETVGATKVVGTSTNYARQDHVHAMPGTFGAATASAAGTDGFVPAPAAGKQTSFLRGDGAWVVPTDTNTHNTAYLYAGAPGTAANASTTNGNTTLVLKDGSAVTGNINITGSGLISVTSNASGVIFIGTSATNNTGTVTTVKMNGTEKSPTSGVVDLGTVITAHQSLSDYAKLASPAFTGTPTAPTATAGTNDTQIATTAFVMNAFTANDAMLFKGTIGSSGATITALPDTHKKGWTYKVATAGTYAGKVCEIGDIVICVTDGTGANNDHWTVIQNNIDGAVTGPASVSNNTNNNVVAVFNGTTGKVIKDSGFTIASSVPANAKFTDTTYIAGTDVAAETVGATKVVGTSTNYARQDHVHAMPGTFGAATASAAGTDGFVPAPGSGKQTSFLRGDGTWAIPTNTTYGITGSLDGNTFKTTITAGSTGATSTVPAMGAATASAAGTAGLVPAPGSGKQASFLRGDGTWVVPTNTTYTAGIGLTLSNTTFKAKLKSETALTNDAAESGNTTNRTYAVAVDKSGYLAVNVPWTDTNTDTKVKSTLTSSGTTKIFLTGMAQATAATATSEEQHNSNVYIIPNTGRLYAATPTAGTNDTSVATTAYVTTAVSNAALTWGSF